MKTLFNTISAVIIFLVLLFFCMNNQQVVEILVYRNIKYNLPVWAVFIVPFFIGTVAGNFLDFFQRLKLKRQVLKLKNELKGLKAEKQTISS